MGRRSWVFALVLACGAVTPAASNPFSSDGEFSVLFRDLTWTPDCSLPYRLGRTREDYEAFKARAEDYMACVDRQAQADAAYAVEQIKAGRQKAYQKLRDEL